MIARVTYALLLGALSLACRTTTVADEVCGSPVLERSRWPHIVLNGDFAITGNNDAPGNYDVGDGSNEHTSWRFAFPRRTVARFADGDCKLVSAALTLTLAAKPSDESDRIRLRGVDPDTFIPTPTSLFRELPSGQVRATLELLGESEFSEDQFRQAFARSLTGDSLQMKYEDDAIVTRARLELRFE